MFWWQFFCFCASVPHNEENLFLPAQRTFIKLKDYASGKYFLQIPPFSKNDLCAFSENSSQRISTQANYCR